MPWCRGACPRTRRCGLAGIPHRPLRGGPFPMADHPADHAGQGDPMMPHRAPAVGFVAVQLDVAAEGDMTAVLGHRQFDFPAMQRSRTGHARSAVQHQSLISTRHLPHL